MSEINTQEPINPAESIVDTTSSADTVDNSSEQLIAGKFKTQDDLIKAYQNLESEFGKKSGELAELKKAPAKPAEETDKAKELNTDDTSLENVKKVAEASKLDWEEFEQDYYNNGGQLSDEMRQKAIDAGVSEQFIDKTISGMQQTAKEEFNKVAEAVGSPEELNAVFKWVTANYDEQKLANLKQAFTAELPLEAAQLIVKGLRDEMLAAEGKAPTYVKGTSGGSTDSGLFESQAQVQAYLADARANYKSPKYDPAYMKAYEDKLKRSKAVGLI